jgi:hypothetical protein
VVAFQVWLFVQNLTWEHWQKQLEEFQTLGEAHVRMVLQTHEQVWLFQCEFESQRVVF